MSANNVTLAATGKKSVRARTQKRYSSEAFPACCWVYYNATVAQMTRAQGNAEAASRVEGLALNEANGAGQPVEVQYAGRANGFSGLPVGRLMIISDDAPGLMMPASDAGSGDWASTCCYTVSATEIEIIPNWAPSAYT